MITPNNTKVNQTEIRDLRMIGWYGKPGRNGGTKTHVVVGLKPVCGARPAGVFQFCSSDHDPAIVECENCRKWLGKQTLGQKK